MVADATPELVVDQQPSKAARWIVRGLLAGVFLALLLFLREADSPWKKGLEALSPEARPSTKNFVVSGLWWAAVANSVLVALLLATTRWWLKVRQKETESPGQKGEWRQCAIRFWLPVLGAIALAAWLGAPRLSLSLWGDEEHTLRTYIMGRFERTDNGSIVEKPNDWQRSLWSYVNPNNQILNTILARLSLSAWRAGWDGRGLPFSETAIRLPGFIAALCGIAMLAFLLRALGFTRAGVIAAWICALHPWYLRYATECRGYAHMLLLLPAALLCLVRLWQNPTWTVGLWLGLCEFLLLYAYPGAFYVLLFANLAFLVSLAVRSIRAGGIAALLPAGRRWLVGSIVGAMVFLQLYGPCIPQLQRYMKGGRAQAGVMDAAWMQDFAGLCVAGTRWSFPDPANTLVVTLNRVLAPRLDLWVALVLFASAALIGFVRLARAGGIATGLAAAFAISIAFTFVHARLINNFLYHWYLIFALPLFIVVMALGIEQYGGWFIRRGWRPTGFLATIVLLAGFAALTSPQREVLMSQPVEAQRESVLRTRPSLGLNRTSVDAALTFGLATGGSHHMTVPSYDPASYYASSSQAVRDLMMKADAERKPLFANIAMPDNARIHYPDVMNILDDPKVFILVKVLYGLEDNVTRYIYRYNPGSAQTHDRPAP